MITTRERNKLRLKKHYAKVDKCDIIYNVRQELEFGPSGDKIGNAYALASKIKQSHAEGKCVGLTFISCDQYKLPYNILFELMRELNIIRNDLVIVYVPNGFRNYIAKAKNRLLEEK